MPTPPLLPPIAGQPISVVLLPRPDADRDAVVAAWRDFLAARGLDHEILTPDNPIGDGAALRDGLARARHPLVCYAPCHLDYRPDYLGQLLDRPFAPEDAPADAAPGKEIDHVHLMSGFRAGVPMPWPLRVLGGGWRALGWLLLSYSPPPWPGWLGWRRWLGGLLARAFFGVRYRDACCPFRLFRREVLPRLPIQSDSAFAHVELVAKANFLGCVLSEELPLDVRPGPYRGDFGRMWAEAQRLFHKPDFGPPPESAAAPPGSAAQDGVLDPLDQHRVAEH